MINSKECAAEDKPGYFIYLSQQKEKGIHMNTFLQSVQNLDGEILLQIQQHLRTDMLTPFMKIVTFLGNGGWFWILCAVVLLAVPKTRKTGYAAVLSLIFGVIVTNLLLKNIVARPRPFAEIEALIPLIAKPTDFSFPSGHTTASNRCPDRVRCCAGGKLAGCVGCEDEAGKSISLITDVEK